LTAFLQKFRTNNSAAELLATAPPANRLFQGPDGLMVWRTAGGNLKRR